MPNFPDVSGKDLLAGTTKRARTIVVATGAGALAVGGFVVRKVLSRGADDPRPGPPATNREPVAKPKPAPKPKAAKPRPKPAKPPKSTAARPKPTKPKPGTEPGDQRGGKDPHHALNNPVADPDETEYPDPYDKREDPRDPDDPDGAPFGEQAHPQTGSRSTSEPPPAQDPEVGDRARPPRRENLDD